MIARAAASAECRDPVTVCLILKGLNATNRTEAVVKVARASASPMSYTYTISGYSTFLGGSFVPMRAVAAEEHAALPTAVAMHLNDR